MDINKLIQRVKSLLISPKTEWPVIAAEPATVGGLYRNYILVLAAIPAACSFIKGSFIGYGSFLFGSYRVSIGAGLGNMVLTYVLSLGMVFALGLIIKALAPKFTGQGGSNQDAPGNGAPDQGSPAPDGQAQGGHIQGSHIQAMKVAAYGFTAGWVASFGLLLPGIAGLIVLAGAIYSIYLLYLGLQLVMQSPADKVGGYTAVTVISAVVLSAVIGLIIGPLSGGSMMGESVVRDRQFDKDSPIGKLEQWGKQVEAAGKKMEAAAKAREQQAPDQEQNQSQDQAMGQAMGEMMGALLGGGGTPAAALQPAQMKDFAPETLGGLPRLSINAERNAAIGLQVSKLDAQYGEDQGGDTLRLQITDAGGARAFLGMVSWAGVEQDSETATGYKRTYRQDGRTLHEEWDGAHNRGQFSLILAERFIVELQGKVESMETLKRAAKDIDLDGLEGLKNEGA